MKHRMMLLVSIVMLTCAAQVTMAEAKVSKEAQAQKEQYTGVEHASHWHELDQTMMRSFHNPTDWLSMGLDFRFRAVYAENIITLNKDEVDRWNYLRYRTRWSTKSKLSEDVDFNTRLVWEFRTWDKPSSKPQSTDFDEMIFDHFNLTFKNAFDMPMTLVVGRQDIILGAGWLVLEGTPNDDSRTIYFDAIRGTLACDDNTTLDLIYINQYDDSEKWLKPINDRDATTLTNGLDERGAILYLTNKGDTVTTEAYYIYKEDKQSHRGKRFETPAGDPAPAKEAEIHTFGGALSGPLNLDWSYRVEGALQTGRKDKEDLQAYGFNSTLAYNFHDAANSQLSLDYEYLSGNDPSTNKNEGFDPLWGEYAQKNRGGDLPVYIYARETTVAETTNLHRLGVRYEFSPCENWTINPMVNFLWADENVEGDPFGSGKERGQMYSLYLKYQCCKKLSAHWLVDYFVPGSFYANTDRDDALFARFNIEYTF